MESTISGAMANMDVVDDISPSTSRGEKRKNQDADKISMEGLDPLRVAGFVYAQAAKGIIHAVVTSAKLLKQIDESATMSANQTLDNIEVLSTRIADYFSYSKEAGQMSSDYCNFSLSIGNPQMVIALSVQKKQIKTMTLGTIISMNLDPEDMALRTAMHQIAAIWESAKDDMRTAKSNNGMGNIHPDMGWQRQGGGMRSAQRVSSMAESGSIFCAARLNQIAHKAYGFPDPYFTGSNKYSKNVFRKNKTDDGRHYTTLKNMIRTMSKRILNSEEAKQVITGFGDATATPAQLSTLASLITSKGAKILLCETQPIVPPVWAFAVSSPNITGGIKDEEACRFMNAALEAVDFSRETKLLEIIQMLRLSWTKAHEVNSHIAPLEVEQGFISKNFLTKMVGSVSKEHGVPAKGVQISKFYKRNRIETKSLATTPFNKITKPVLAGEYTVDMHGVEDIAPSYGTMGIEEALKKASSLKIEDKYTNKTKEEFVEIVPGSSKHLVGKTEYGLISYEMKLIEQKKENMRRNAELKKARGKMADRAKSHFLVSDTIDEGEVADAEFRERAGKRQRTA